MKTTFSIVLFFLSLSISAQKKVLKSEEIKIPIYANLENVESIVKEERAAFVYFGIYDGIDRKKFKEKYGIDVKVEGCVITPYFSDLVTKNNLAIQYFLNKKYGDRWKKELEYLPYGLK